MKQYSIPALALAIAAGISIFVLSAPSAPASAVTATVSGGKIEGRSVNGVASFKGIPYAAPPVGNLRWKAPAPIAPWTGVRTAGKYAPACMQNSVALFLMGGRNGRSEDCLYLNVWTPQVERNAKLPVMVFIHGGAFQYGTPGADMYSGDRLVREGHVVIVSVAYRLGAFGLLAHPDLTRGQGQGSGNWGIEDQTAALRWVQENIANFGGDPRNVTIFGESAGAFSVGMLAASPTARGLFQRVISQSGGSYAPAQSGKGFTQTQTLSQAEANGRAFMTNLKVGGAEEARHKNAEDVLKAAEGVTFQPVQDGYVLPDRPATIYANRQFNDTPIMVGTNADEGSMFVPKGDKASFEKSVHELAGPLSSDVLSHYPHATDAEALQAARDVVRDMLLAWPTYAWARAQTEYGQNKAYIYYFEHKSKAEPAGAKHASELGLVFDYKVPDGDKAVGKAMRTRWLNFARTGDPNGPGLEYWPAYSTNDEKAMVFAPSGVQALPNLQKLKVWDRYYERVSNAPGE